jgi:hypothetical protein
MEVHRINGLKFNFDRLSDDELESIHGHLLAQHQQVTDEIGLVESALFARRHEQLPMNGEVHDLGHVALSGEVAVQPEL